MTHTDIHLDAMLRHLGTVYYESLSGSATRADVAGPWTPPGIPASPGPALAAGQLMTTPAITIGPDATLPAAARLMDTRHIRRLPVTSDDGKLPGIISRRDLLSVFLRPDEDIAAYVRRPLDEFLLVGVDATVRNGIITFIDTPAPAGAGHADAVGLQAARNPRRDR